MGLKFFCSLILSIMPSNKFHKSLICVLLIISTFIPTSESITCTSSICSCTTNKACALNCSGKDVCKGNNVKLTCQPNQPCNILCNGDSTCQDAVINSNDAINTSLNCTGGDDVCSAATVICGSGHCAIYCDLSADASCKDMKVNTRKADTFECNGNCPKTLIPFSSNPNPLTPSPSLSPITMAPNTQIPSSSIATSNIFSSSSPSSIPTDTIYYTVPTKKSDVVFAEEEETSDQMLWIITGGIGCMFCMILCTLFCCSICKKKRDEKRLNMGDGKSEEYEKKESVESEQMMLNDQESSTISDIPGVDIYRIGMPPTRDAIRNGIALPMKVITKGNKSVSVDSMEGAVIALPASSSLHGTMK